MVGATTAFRLSWLTWLLFPMMAVVLVIATQVGAVTGRDLQQCVRDRFPRVVQWALLLSIVAVSVLTIAADAHAGASALALLIPVDPTWLLVFLAVGVVGLLLLGSYHRVEQVLKYVLLCLLAYPVAAVLAHPDWGQVLHDTLFPRLSTDPDVVYGALALLGTTITGYVYVWQTIQTAEERAGGRNIDDGLRWGKKDAVVGVFFTVVIMWFILVATGATLGARHQQVNSAEDAAQALAPLAGRYAGQLFGVGLLASALLALPVLIASTGYIIASQLGRPRGLSEPVRRAPAFYFTIVMSTVVAVVITATDSDTIRLLLLASVIGGIATPIGLAALMAAASDGDLMGDRAIGGALRVAGWAVKVAIALLSGGYLLQQIAGGSS
ncbi:MAG: hypothetical protein JWR88_1363 [Pseudonocardia sp.]|nr:hypothetical protein [Pseudonocardia sp.]